MNLETLAVAGRKDLLERWQDLFGKPPPKGLSSPFLRRFLAFELQARRRGGLPKTFRRDLSRETSTRTKARTPALRPGSRLLREWNGATHVVDVLEDGYLWQGERHRSLSAIARAITGTHWSGPRFFGLHARSGP